MLDTLSELLDAPVGPDALAGSVEDVAGGHEAGVGVDTVNEAPEMVIEAFGHRIIQLDS